MIANSNSSWQSVVISGINYNRNESKFPRIQGTAFQKFTKNIEWNRFLKINQLLYRGQERDTVK